MPRLSTIPAEHHAAFPLPARPLVIYLSDFPFSFALGPTRVCGWQGRGPEQLVVFNLCSPLQCGTMTAARSSSLKSFPILPD